MSETIQSFIDPHRGRVCKTADGIEFWRETSVFDPNTNQIHFRWGRLNLIRSFPRQFKYHGETKPKWKKLRLRDKINLALNHNIWGRYEYERYDSVLIRDTQHEEEIASHEIKIGLRALREAARGEVQRGS